MDIARTVNSLCVWTAARPYTTRAQGRDTYLMNRNSSRVDLLATQLLFTINRAVRIKTSYQTTL
jgi:hypothetical protein